MIALILILILINAFTIDWLKSFNSSNVRQNRTIFSSQGQYRNQSSFWKIKVPDLLYTHSPLCCSLGSFISLMQMQKNNILLTAFKTQAVWEVFPASHSSALLERIMGFAQQALFDFMSFLTMCLSEAELKPASQCPCGLLPLHYMDRLFSRSNLHYLEEQSSIQ